VAEFHAILAAAIMMVRQALPDRFHISVEDGNRVELNGPHATDFLSVDLWALFEAEEDFASRARTNLRMLLSSIQDVVVEGIRDRWPASPGQSSALPLSAVESKDGAVLRLGYRLGKLLGMRDRLAQGRPDRR